MLDVRPDPKHPRGGYAVFCLSFDEVPSGEVSLTVRNRFNDKYLNKSGWQSAKAYFGPYMVRASGDHAEIVVGTEIVNLVEEYTPVTVEIGDKQFEVTWPDDIIPGPPSAVVGGVSPTPPKMDANRGPSLVGKASQAAQTGLDDGSSLEEQDDNTASIDAPTAQARYAQAPGEADKEQEPSRSWIVPSIIGAILLCLIGAGGYWFLGRSSDTGPDVPAVTQTEESQGGDAVVIADPCSEAALAKVAQSGFESLLTELDACANEMSANAAFELMERGVDANDPAAIAAFGRLYDADEVLEVVETTLGITYADNPALAAQYYARAVQAGDGVGAFDALAAVCSRLASEADDLSLTALEDYCPKE